MSGASRGVLWASWGVLDIFCRPSTYFRVDIIRRHFLMKSTGEGGIWGGGGGKVGNGGEGVRVWPGGGRNHFKSLEGVKPFCFQQTARAYLYHRLCEQHPAAIRAAPLALAGDRCSQRTRRPGPPPSTGSIRFSFDSVSVGSFL